MDVKHIIHRQRYITLTTHSFFSDFCGLFILLFSVPLSIYRFVCVYCWFFSVFFLFFSVRLDFFAFLFKLDVCTVFFFSLLFIRSICCSSCDFNACYHRLLVFLIFIVFECFILIASAQVNNIKCTLFDIFCRLLLFLFYSFDSRSLYFAWMMMIIPWKFTDCKHWIFNLLQTNNDGPHKSKVFLTQNLHNK